MLKFGLFSTKAAAVSSIGFAPVIYSRFLSPVTALREVLPLRMTPYSSMSSRA